MIVAARRNVGEAMKRLIDGLGFEVVNVTPIRAPDRANHEKSGKGVHAAALNFGDCFAYEVAKEHSCRLLYVGEDFTQTDVEPLL